MINPKEYLNSADFYPTEHKASTQLEQQVDKIKTNIDPKLFLAIYSSVVLLHEHSLRAVRSYIFAINKVLAIYPKAVFILPWCASSSNVYLYESEGETQLSSNHPFYRKGDFLFTLLIDYFESRQIPYRVILKPRLTFLYYSSHTLRRIFRIFARLIFVSFKLIYSFFRSTQVNFLVPIKPGKPVNVFISRSPVHSEYLCNAATKTKNAVLLLDTVPLYRSNVNKHFCKNLNLPAYDLSKYINLSDIFSVIQLYYQLSSLLLRSKEQRFFLRSKDIRLPVAVDLSQYICESIVLSWEAQLLLRRIRRWALANRYKMRTLNHLEMFSQFPNHFYSLKTTSKDTLRVNILSFGTYDLPPLPNTILSDNYYSFNIAQCKDLRRFNPCANPTYSGNSFITSPTLKLELGNRIFFFSQPYQVEQEIEILSQLINNFPHELTYIEHPRTNSSYIEKISALFKQLNIVRSFDYFVDRDRYDPLMRFAITRTSNVGYRLLLQGKPIIYLKDLDKDFSVSLDFFRGYPLLANSCDHAIKLIRSHHSIEEFIKFRSGYLTSNYCLLGAKELANSISSNLG